MEAIITEKKPALTNKKNWITFSLNGQVVDMKLPYSIEMLLSNSID